MMVRRRRSASCRWHVCNGSSLTAGLGTVVELVGGFGIDGASIFVASDGRGSFAEVSMLMTCRIRYGRVAKQRSHSELS